MLSSKSQGEYQNRLGIGLKMAEDTVKNSSKTVHSRNPGNRKFPPVKLEVKTLNS